MARKKKGRQVYFTGNKEIFLAFFALLFVFLIFLTAFIGKDIGEKPVGFSIEPGQSFLTIGGKLSNQELVLNRVGFWLYILLTGNATDIKAGEYMFDGPISISRLTSIITRGSGANEKVIFIPEGFNIAQINERLAEEGILKDQNITKSDLVVWKEHFSFLQDVPDDTDTLEGFLFPDSYRFERDTTKGVVIEKMLKNFEQKTQKIRSQVEARGESFYDIVKIASILEKEVPPRDMKTAAGVIENRLEIGMALQVDATLVYALGRPIVREDIDTLDSPYNTYNHRGLPPTPISNPGLTALEAALNPGQNSFFFYLTRRDTGETIFSRTFEQHDNARARYLR